MSNYFNINNARAALLMHPTFLRRPLMIAFIKAMMKPLDKLNGDFSAYRESLDTNTYSQVCYMQGVLNDLFDPLERRIRIRNAARNINAFLYWREGKNRPVRLMKEGTPDFIPRLENRDGLIGVDNADFEIVLPIGYELSEHEETILKSFVDQNKLASKHYIITNG